MCSSLSDIKILDTKNKLEETDTVNNLVVKDYSYDGEILTQDTQLWQISSP